MPESCDHPSKEEFKVLVTGGGIAGLCIALRLHGQGFHDVTILERSSSSDYEGFALNLQPHACQVLHELNLLEQVCSVSWSPVDQRYYTFDGRLVAASARGLLAGKDFPQVSIHRGLLLAILERAVSERLGRKSLRRGFESKSYSQTGSKVALTVLNHATGEANVFQGDLLIVADGLKSPLRKQLLGREEGPPKRSGLSLFRAVVPHSVTLEGHSILVAGDSKAKLVCYPVSKPFHSIEMPHGNCGAAEIASCWQSAGDSAAIPDNVEVMQCMNFVVVLPEVQSDVDVRERVSADRVLSRLDAAAQGRFDLPFFDFRRMIRRARDFRVWPMVDRDPVEQIVDGRVVLAGDAAHPMYANGSNGASSAMQGAAALVDTLAATWEQPDTHVEEALAAHQASFLPAVTAVQLACRGGSPEKIMDRVHGEVAWGAPVPPDLASALLKCLGAVQAQSVAAAAAAGPAAPPSLVTRPLTSRRLVSSVSPLERVLLLANSTLQAVMSAYTNQDIVVVPLYSVPRPDAAAYDRLVHLRVGSRSGAVIARCWSVVVPRSERVRGLIGSQSAGIGQLFALNSVPPSFRLIAVGKYPRNHPSPLAPGPAGTTPSTPQARAAEASSPSGPTGTAGWVLTRQYVVDGEELRCLIFEEIDLDTLTAGYSHAGGPPAEASS